MPGLPARTQHLRSTQEQLTAGQDKSQRKDDAGRPNVATLRSTLLSLPPHRCRRTTPVARVLADGPCAGHEMPSTTSKPKSSRLAFQESRPGESAECHGRPSPSARGSAQLSAQLRWLWQACSGATLYPEVPLGHGLCVLGCEHRSKHRAIGLRRAAYKPLRSADLHYHKCRQDGLQGIRNGGCVCAAQFSHTWFRDDGIQAGTRHQLQCSFHCSYGVPEWLL